MADGDVSSLIDLNCSIKDHISVPLLPAPKINSPFEADLSSDYNNPFDSAIQAASFLDDPFEIVSKKVQEFVGICNLGESGIVTLEGSHGCSSDGVLVSEREESEKSETRINVMTDVKAPKSEETNGTTRSDIHDAHSLKNCEIQEKRRSIESVDLLSHIKNKYVCKSKPDINCKESQYNELEMCDVRNTCSVNNSILAQSENSKYSPKSVSPKYSSTPIIVNYKRKVREGESPNCKKRVSLDLGSISPASFVRDRVEKCIAETQNKYRDSQETTSEFGRQTFRRSLDSQMPQYSNYTTGYQGTTNYTSKQNCKSRFSLQTIRKTDSRDDFYCSFKSLQMPTNGLGFEMGSFPHFEHVEKCNRLEDDSYLHEAKVLSKLFEAAATSSGSSLANESAVILVESDTDQENNDDDEKYADEENKMTEDIDNFDSKVEKSTTRRSWAGKENTRKSFQHKRRDPLKNLGSRMVPENSLKILLSKVSSNTQLSSRDEKTTGLTTPSHNSVSRVKSDSCLRSRKDAAKFGKCSPTLKLNKTYADQKESVTIQTPQAKGISSGGKTSKMLKKMLQSKKTLTGK